MNEHFGLEQQLALKKTAIRQCSNNATKIQLRQDIEKLELQIKEQDDG